MTNITTYSPTTTRPGSAAALLVGAAGFLLTFLAADPISSSLASGPPPQPNVSGTVTKAWITQNTIANTVQAMIMILSAAFLAVFIGSWASITRRVGGRVRLLAIGTGFTAICAMVVSCVLSWELSASASTMSPATVAQFRTANFIAGGMVHVALLGLFVLAASCTRGVSAPVRVLAIITALIAVASLVSLAVYNASILILAGRLLGMTWCLVASVSVIRRRRKEWTSWHQDQTMVDRRP